MKKRIILKVIILILIVACKNNENQNIVNQDEQSSEIEYSIEDREKLSKLNHSIEGKF